MELPIKEPYLSEPANDVGTPQKQRFAGAVLFLLIFLASAGVTAIYLTGDVTPAPAAEAAAAAEITGPNPYVGLNLQAQSAYVLDISDGHVLYALNPDVQLPLASLTKVPLTLAVSSALSPDALITIPYDTAPAGSAERLAAGQKWKVQDVINFTLIASSNDGADILAAAADDDIRAQYPQAPAQHATLWRMNKFAQDLGLTHTYFLNDNGLDISTTQAGAYGSAHDVAVLFAYAATSAPQVFGGTTRGGMLLTSSDGAHTSAFNTDLALGSIPGLIMGKTGYTDLAGGNLAIVFDVGPGRPVVAVVLHSTQDDRFTDMKKLVAATLQAIAQGR
jgi:D-alanyl-D-alanine carboxypeptidase (penicillin-binding protein 5/6)